MLRLDHITKRYRGPAGIVTALDDLSLQVAAGEFVAVRGPSGSGKTTLLLAAGGLLAPDSGRVLVGGHDLYALSPGARARFRAGHLGFVFQQFHLVPYLSVLENVLAAGLGGAARNGDPRQRALDLLERFGLTARQGHVPGQLSTGERQRTALARALLNQPKVLLADEPTGNLDSDNGRRVLECLADFARQGGAVLLVTHDDRAAGYCHRVQELRSPAAACPDRPAGMGGS